MPGVVLTLIRRPANITNAALNATIVRTQDINRCYCKTYCNKWKTTMRQANMGVFRLCGLLILFQMPSLHRLEGCSVQIDEGTCLRRGRRWAY